MIDPNHCVLDLIDCDTLMLSEPDLMKTFLKSLPKHLDLSTIGDPIVHKFNDPEKGSGLTGFQILSDSHVAIHTYDREKVVYLDVFSCKKFDRNKFIDFCKSFFVPTKYYMNSIARYKHL